MKLFVSFYAAPPYFGPVTFWNFQRPSTVAAYRKFDDAINLTSATLRLLPEQVKWEFTLRRKRPSRLILAKFSQSDFGAPI
ncbi:MAG: hypothetical protein JST84_24845 [Acidobacteria bacterium]|nr:hypothetical protein [Acidobacteriota bacterium]